MRAVDAIEEYLSDDRAPKRARRGRRMPSVDLEEKAEGKALARMVRAAKAAQREGF